MKERALGRVRERLLIVERNVAGPWMLASGFSAADIYAAMFSRWSVGREWRDANLPRLKALGEALGKRPKLNRIWQRHFGG